MKPSAHKSLLAAAVCCAVTAPSVHAQLEEVIVTAERREASLQETPISIQVVSSEQIQSLGIRSALDLVDQIAGVQGYTPPGSTSDVGFNIRGVGDGSPNIATDPGTARYIDDVYIGKVLGSGMDVVDLARIEILNGPQGTLYGRNSIAGAVNFVARAPDDEFGLTLRGTSGNYNQGAFSARVDLPITDSFRVSGSTYIRKRDEFWANTNPSNDGLNNTDRDGYRMALQWDVTDRLTIDYIYSEDNVNDEFDNHSVVSGLNPNYAGIAGYAAAGGDLASVPIDSNARPQIVAGLAGFVNRNHGLSPVLSRWRGGRCPCESTRLPSRCSQPQRKKPAPQTVPCLRARRRTARDRHTLRCQCPPARCPHEIPSGCRR